MSVDGYLWEQLIGLMGQERELLVRFAEASDQLKTKLHRREWMDLDDSFKTMEDMADQLNTLEQNRVDLTGRICGVRDFACMVSELEPEFRARVNHVRSELKARLLTVKSRTLGIMGYAERQCRLSREFVEALFPSTRGRIYDKRGRSASGERDSMLLSRHL